MSADTPTSPELIDHKNSPHHSTDSTLRSANDDLANSASSVMSAAQNHPATQQVKDTVVNGPVGQAVQNATAQTTSEFKDLANSRTTPAEPAATGQPLTHYHSLFYRLLSWKSPRATGIVFATCVALIFASRYLNVLRYSLKLLYTALGATAAAEVAGKVLLGNGLTSQVRPKSYVTIRKESLERFLDDVEQLINFVVIEFQRILFAENIWVTVGACVSSFLSYWLIKWLPLWGLTLLATSVTFLAPLIYIENQEFIDAHLNHAGHMINAQASQVRDLAAQHTSNATGTIRSYAGDYSQKAQQMINDARGKATNGSAGNPVKPTGNPVKSADFPNNPTGNPVKSADFPNAPKTEPIAPKIPQSQPAY